MQYQLCRPLAERFGADLVWDVSIEVLGYPILLFHSMPEVLRVQEALEKKCGGEIVTS